MEYLTDRITIDPEVCNGRPVFRGLRITVETILGFLSAGEDVTEILHQYPDLDKQDIEAALKFAQQLMDRKYTIRAAA